MLTVLFRYIAFPDSGSKIFDLFRRQIERSSGVGIGLIRPGQRVGHLNLSFVRDEHVLGMNVSNFNIAVSNGVAVLFFSCTEGI